MASFDASTTMLTERDPSSRPRLQYPEEEQKHVEVSFRKRPIAINDVNAKRGIVQFKNGRLTSTKIKTKHIDEIPFDVNSSGKDVSVHLTIDVQIDVTEDVTELSRLNRLGRFREGIQLYEQKLKSHTDFFPVAAEYADLLLQQGSYGAASSFVSECLSAQEESKISATKFEYEHEQKLLLKSIQALADIFSQGHLEKALEVALDVSTALERIEYEGLRVHLIENYMRIISFAELNSSFLYREEFWRLLALSSLYPNETLRGYIFPLTQYSCKQLGNWYYHLRQQGFYWEAHRFLQIVLAMLEHNHTLRPSPESTEDSLSTLFVSFMRVRQLDALASLFLDIKHVLSHGDEQLTLTEFANASLIGNFLASFMTRRDEHLKAAKACLVRARELGKVIFNNYPDLLSSRTFLEWMLTEKARSERIRQGPSLSVKPSTNTSFRGGPDMISSFGRYIVARTLDTEMSTIHKSKEHDAASLWRILSSAEKLGDFLLQRSVLQQIIKSSPISGSSSHSACECLETCEKLADLELNTMNDLPGYIECRSEQYALIDSLPLPEDQVKARTKLCEEIQHFDRLYPSDSDLTDAARDFLSHPLFQIHASDVLRKCVYSQLLRDLHRNKEAHIVEAQLYHLEDNAPGFTKVNRDILIRRHYLTGYGRRKERGIHSPPSSSYSSDSDSDISPRIVSARRRLTGEQISSKLKDPLGDSEGEYENARYGASTMRRAESRFTPEQRSEVIEVDTMTGKPTFPSTETHKKAATELGYPFTEQDGRMTIEKALKTEQISDYFNLSDALERDPQPTNRQICSISHFENHVDSEDEHLEHVSERSSSDLTIVPIERKAALTTQTGIREYRRLVNDEEANDGKTPNSRSRLRSPDRRLLPPENLYDGVKHEALRGGPHALVTAEEGLKDETPKESPKAKNEDTGSAQPLKRQATVELDGDRSREDKE